MRKLILGCVIGFLLLACGDENNKAQITSNYLVGKWDCQSKGSSAKWINGEFLEYGGTEQKNNIFEFKIDDGVLYSTLYSDDKFSKFIIPNPAEPNYFNGDDRYRVKFVRKFEDISPNKFTFKTELEFSSNKPEDESIYNFKIKNEDFCIRIK